MQLNYRTASGGNLTCDLILYDERDVRLPGDQGLAQSFAHQGRAGLAISQLAKRFEIKLHNNSNQKVLAQLSVDGKSINNGQKINQSYVPAPILKDGPGMYLRLSISLEAKQQLVESLNAILPGKANLVPEMASVGQDVIQLSPVMAKSEEFVNLVGSGLEVLAKQDPAALKACQERSSNVYNSAIWLVHLTKMKQSVLVQESPQLTGGTVANTLGALADDLEPLTMSRSEFADKHTVPVMLMLNQWEVSTMQAHKADPSTVTLEKLTEQNRLARENLKPVCDTFGMSAIRW